jgi:predicted Fe-Mo cluster-binding NifX family protein
MRVAIPIVDGRISPVFDVAKRLLLVDVEQHGQLRRTEEGLGETLPELRAERVAKLGVDVLICGAISWPLQSLLVSAGVDVIPQTCGQVDEVVRAFLSGQLVGDAFVMPGCCGRRRRFRGGRRRGWRSQ